VNLVEGASLYLNTGASTRAVISLCDTCSIAANDGSDLVGSISGNGIITVNSANVLANFHQMNIAGSGLKFGSSSSSIIALATVSATSTTFEFGTSNILSVNHFVPTDCNIILHTGTVMTMSPTSPSSSIWTTTRVIMDDHTSIKIQNGAVFECDDTTVITMSGDSTITIDASSTLIASSLTIHDRAATTSASLVVHGVLSVGTLTVDRSLTVASTGLLHFGISASGKFGDLIMDGLATFGDANWMIANSITLSDTSRLVLVLDVNDPLDLVAINAC
jgi:hypothetical protein